MGVSLQAAFQSQKSTGKSNRKAVRSPTPEQESSSKRRKTLGSENDGTQTPPSRNESAHHRVEGQDAVPREPLDTQSTQSSLINRDPSSSDVVGAASPSSGRFSKGVSLLSKDVVMLKEIIQESQRKLISTLNSKATSSDEVIGALLTRLSTLEETVSKNSEQLMELVYVFSKKDKKKKASEKDKKMDAELLILDVLVSDDVVERVMEHCTISTLEKFIEKVSIHQVPVQASAAFRTIMFSKPVGAPISLFSSGIGQEHSLYRKRIVASLIESLRKNLFSQLEPEEDQIDARRISAVKAGTKPKSNVVSSTTSRIHPSTSGVEDAGINDMKPRFPKWLKEGFILDKHIEQVKNSREVTQSETSGTRKSKQIQLNRNDIACEVVERIFKQVINRIKVGRECGKNAFFQEVGYLFVVWSQILSGTLAKEVNQESVDLQWYAEKSEGSDTEIDDIPNTKYVPRVDLNYSCADDNPNDYNFNNVKLFAEFIEDHPEMILQISHDVLVKTSRRGKGSTEKRKLVRYINLLDVAARVISHFVGVRNPSSPMSILSSVPGAIKCLYSLALLFRGMIDGIMKGLGEYGCSVLYRTEDNEDDQLGEYEAVYYESITIGDLLPSKTRQLKTMNKCVVLTEGEFRSINEATKGGNHSADDDGESFHEEQEEEDEDDF